MLQGPPRKLVRSGEASPRKWSSGRAVKVGQGETCDESEGEHARQREWRAQRPCEGDALHVLERERPGGLGQSEGGGE